VPLPAAEPPQPFSLPALVREVPVLSLEHTSAIIGLDDQNLLDVATGEIGFAHAGFASLEVPVLELDRGWFVGARWGYVGAAVPGRPSHTFPTNPEAWWRVASVGRASEAADGTVQPGPHAGRPGPKRESGGGPCSTAGKQCGAAAVGNRCGAGGRSR